MVKKKIEFGSNSFDYLRLFAAIQVIVFHSVAHLEFKLPSFLETTLSMFRGVVILFVISGYLITASYEKTQDNKLSYLKKRILRIYPGLHVAFLISALSIVLLYKIRGSIASVLTWIFTQITFFQFYTPSFLRDYGVGVPNGSLWTITVELQFYVFIMLSYKIIKRIKVLGQISFFALLLLLNAGMNPILKMMPDMVTKLYQVSCLPYLYLCVLGMLLYIHRNRLIGYISQYWYFIFVVFYIYTYLQKTYNFFEFGIYVNVIQGILLGILTIGIAYRFGKRRLVFDISYGLYLYHMIIINILVEIGILGTRGFIITLILTMICAFASYYCVEAPALKIKDKFTI